MASTVNIGAFLQSLNLKDEYLQHSIDTGFDDLDLLHGLTEEERQYMFTLVGLSKKPGHLLNFKKALAEYGRANKQSRSASGYGASKLIEV